MVRAISQVSSRLDMYQVFEKVYTTRERKPSLKALVVLSDASPISVKQWVESQKSLRKYFSVSVTDLENNIYRLSLAKTMHQTTIKGDILVDTSVKGAWILFTDEKRYFIRHCLETLLDALYPEISRLYFNFKQVLEFLNIVKQAYQGQRFVTAFTVQREPRNKPGRRGRLSLREERAEEELEQQNRTYKLWVEKLDFDIVNESGMTLVQASITRNGLCRLRYGSFQDFYMKILHILTELGLDWEKFYSKREKSVRNGLVELHPYRINYPFRIEEDHFKTLAAIFSKDYSTALIHGGNPYFVTNLADYRDGSSFGVTILGNAVTVTPITKASPASSWKLASRIQDYLGEGEVLNVDMPRA